MDRLHLALGMTTALVLGIGIGHARTSMYSFFFHKIERKTPETRTVMEHSYMKRQIKRGKGHYSKAVVANGMVFVSGILPIKHSSEGSEKMIDASFAEQAKHVLNRLKMTLEDSGSALRKLVSIRVYIDDIANWTQFNEIYSDFLGETNLPARAVVPVPELHYGLKIELEAVAMY